MIITANTKEQAIEYLKARGRNGKIKTYPMNINKFFLIIKISNNSFNSNFYITRHKKRMENMVDFLLSTNNIKTFTYYFIYDHELWGRTNA